jgi:hypothetical protein
MNTKELSYVKCTEEYWEFVRELRNDPTVQDGFIENAHITPEMQIGYMTKYADDYRVCLLGDIPVGYFGAIDDDIRTCTLPGYQGKGIGTFMMVSCMEVWPTSYAKVKIGNTASEKMLLKAGFTAKYTIFRYEKK